MMSKGTIVYIGGFELPDKNAAAHRVLSNGIILKKLGYKVVFIGIVKEKNVDILEPQYNKINGFESWLISHPKSYFDWVKYLVSYKKIKKIIDLYDNVYAVIAYNYQSIALWRMTNKYKNKIKIISDTTEWYNDEGNNFLHRQIKNLDTYFRMKIVNKKVNGLIVTSEYLAKYYRDKHVVKIPTLVGDIFPQVENLEVNNPTKIIYFGVPFRFGKHYKDKTKAKDRLDLVVELFHLLHLDGIDFKFNIYGLSKEQYLFAIPEHNDIVNDLENKISFYGFVESNIVRKEVSKSDFSIFIRDSNKTTMAGFPTKFTESIMCGTPVITTNTSDLNEYLIDGQNGFFLDFDQNSALLKLKDIICSGNTRIIRMKEYCKTNKIFHTDLWVAVMDEFMKK